MLRAESLENGGSLGVMIRDTGVRVPHNIKPRCLAKPEHARQMPHSRPHCPRLPKPARVVVPCPNLQSALQTPRILNYQQGGYRNSPARTKNGKASLDTTECSRGQPPLWPVCGGSRSPAVAACRRRGKLAPLPRSPLPPVWQFPPRHNRRVYPAPKRCSTLWGLIMSSLGGRA